MWVLQHIGCLFFFYKPIWIGNLTNPLLIKASYNTYPLISNGTTAMWTGLSLLTPTFTGFEHI